jgi:hypothetical protein
MRSCGECSGSAAAAATPGILPLQTTRPSAFNPPTRPSVSGRAKVAPSSGRAPFNSGGKASVRAKGKGDGAAEFRKTAASGRPLHRKAALNEVKEKLTNHDASDGTALPRSRARWAAHASHMQSHMLSIVLSALSLKLSPSVQRWPSGWRRSGYASSDWRSGDSTVRFA